MAPRHAYVHAASLRLAAGVDPREPGAAVTVALCGHWEHEDPCRWPHNSDIGVDGDLATFRTVFVAPPEEEAEVRARIATALESSPGWEVAGQGPRPLHPGERSLAAKLATVPLPGEDDKPARGRRGNR